MAFSLVLISAVGFDTAYGYGSGGHSKRVDTAPVVTTAPAQQGQVLGAQDFRFSENLRQGMRSDDVKELQARLRTEGFFTFHTDTGYFGPITFAAVKAYQTAHPAIGYVTGFVGPLTRAELNK